MATYFEQQGQDSPPNRRAMMRARFFAAMAGGDQGNEAKFIYNAPFLQAPRNQVFPNQQSNPAAATPYYNAGPQVGAINSQPGISLPIALKNAPGTLFGISVTTAGSAPGVCYDNNNSVAANPFFVIPNTVGFYPLDWPCQQGIFIVPGTGQVLSAKWA